MKYNRSTIRSVSNRSFARKSEETFDNRIKELEEKTKDAVKVGDSQAGTVPVSDGNNNYTWEKPADAINGEDIDTGNAVKILGINEDGDVIKADVPTGTVTVDTELSLESTNPLQNKVITEELNKIIDGRTPVAKAELAEQLENVSENSGSVQETPFIFQGTGTENNTTSTPTAPKAKQLEKQGNTVVKNQLVQTINSENSTFRNNTNGTIVDGVATFTATAQNGGLNADINSKMPLVPNHKYLIMLTGKCATTNDKVEIRLNNTADIYGTSLVTFGTSFSQKFVLVNYTGEYVLAGNVGYIQVSDTRDSDWNEIQVKDVYLIDLTQWFSGNDNIPSYLLSHPETFINYYNGSLAYNTGEIANSNARYLESIRFNQWDEIWEVGGINTTTGANDNTVTNSIRSKNYIRVIPNTTYYTKCPAGQGGRYFYYDENKNFIEAKYLSENNTFVIPNNCTFVRFTMSSSYGTIYNNDICINLSWDAERDGEYAPFVKYRYDTGTEVLRSAGKARDRKYNSGLIDRNVDDVDLATLNFTQYATNKYSAPFNLIKDVATSVAFNGTCDKLTAIPNADTLDASKKQMSYHNGVLYVANSDWASASDITGTLHYELATPTTEQGTPFDEIIDVDDYGTQASLDTDGNLVAIPQGWKIFYPADYSLIIDDLNNYVNGDVTNLAKKTDLEVVDDKADNIYAIMKENVGGTLRHQLVANVVAGGGTLDFRNTNYLDMGELTWGYDTYYPRFYATLPSDVKHDVQFMPNALCTKYKNDNSGGMNFFIYNDGKIYVYDNNYTDATTFQAAMKNVLLAYEKA